MNKPADDLEQEWPPETVGPEQKRRLAFRAAEPREFETLQEKLRNSGLPRNPDGTYQTNEGSIALESPTEAGRRAIYAESAKGRRDYFYKGVRDPATVAMAKKLSADKELDIDWGIYAPDHDPKDDPMYGPCEGGPYHGKNNVHHETPMLVAIDDLSGRALEGQVGPSQMYPKIRWGAYNWQADTKIWKWDDEPRQASETPK